MTWRNSHPQLRFVEDIAKPNVAQNCTSKSSMDALPALLQQLCIADVHNSLNLATVCHAYTINSECLAAFAQTTAPAPTALANAVLKRQVEFAAGRCCATQALRQLGYLGTPQIGIGAHRAPSWPEGYLGSISHSQGWAVALAGLSAEPADRVCGVGQPSAHRMQGIGIDLEAILPNSTAQCVARRIATSSELGLGTAHGLAFETWVSLLFSAKESLFKALYPTVGRYFHFLDAYVDELDLQQAELSLRLVQSLSAQHVAGQHYRIQFALGQHSLVTRCLFAT